MTRRAVSAASASVGRRNVIAFRWQAHQLDRGSGTLANTSMLDYGVQDTGPRGARWALANRGVTTYHETDTFLAWTLRGAPNLYRRSDARAIALATSPFDETDAAKRVFDASKPLKAAGVPVLEALATIAGHERTIVSKRTVKGVLSTALTPLLADHSKRWCNPCQTTHAWEQPFRLSALQAGLELEPETSPPVLRRITGAGRPLMFERSGDDAEPAFHVLRNYLRFFGPARITDAAVFVDMPVKVVRERWPEDAVAVDVTDLPAGKEPRWLLAEDLDRLRDAAPAEREGAVVRLLGGYDGYLQLRDRDTLVDDPAHAKDLWRILGRPGALAIDGEVVGTWRPSSKGSRLTVTVAPWTKVSKRVRDRAAEQAELLAQVRDQELAGLVVSY